MDGRKNNKGTLGNKGGRPPKADEVQLIEKLTPLAPLAFKALEDGLKEQDKTCLKLFFEYFYGKPKQQIETAITTDSIAQLVIAPASNLKNECNPEQ